jgi:hypothetical protein
MTRNRLQASSRSIFRHTCAEETGFKAIATTEG